MKTSYLVKEVFRFKPSTVGLLILKSENLRSRASFCSPCGRLYWRLRSPYQVVIYRRKLFFVNLHTGRIYEHV